MSQGILRHPSEWPFDAEFMLRGANRDSSRRRSPMGNDCRMLRIRYATYLTGPGAGTAPGPQGCVTCEFFRRGYPRGYCPLLQRCLVCNQVRGRVHRQQMGVLRSCWSDVSVPSFWIRQRIILVLRLSIRFRTDYSHANICRSPSGGAKLLFLNKDKGYSR